MLSGRITGILRLIGSQASQSGRVTLQASAIQKLKSLSEKRGQVILRLKVERYELLVYFSNIISGGCGGFSYHFDVEPSSNVISSDKVFNQEGQSVVVDDVSMSFLKDCEIDYHEEMVRSSFRVVKNSMADSSCGCGASFSVGS